MSVIKYRIGQPEVHVPSAYSPMPRCEVVRGDVVSSGDAGCAEYGIPRFETDISHRGLVFKMPMKHECGVYGLGLQLKSFQHRGSKKVLRVNADPRSNSGDSHAPVPFFVTTAGYGVYFDTARAISLHFSRQFQTGKEQDAMNGNRVATSTDELYAVRENMNETYLVAEIPYAQGVDVYFITGDTILDIVSQYNMLSGGGCLPPLWGLGVYYRCYSKFSEGDVLALSESIREQKIPCDVIGLEPGWQSHTYSCSYLWDAERFPHPEEMIRKLTGNGYRVNLWEHAFIHPTSPLYAKMAPYSANQLVWEGLVPDFTLQRARETFAEYQKKLVAQGVTGFKLDECDGSDFTGGWSFSDCSRFPSGIEGDQYHSMFGKLYAQTMAEALGGESTWSQVRNMGALCASYPFVLYSDLYEQRDFLMGVVNSGFSGILWSPELREASCEEELLRRLQILVFSHQTLVNTWYLEKTPWEDLGCTDKVRSLFEWRMRLIPYLYTAFYDYQKTGRPPIRALVCDYQNEKETWDCSDEYLFGDSMIVAPILYPEKERTVFLPKGNWYDLFTGEKFAGGTHVRSTDGIPVYVKEGTILPLAKPVSHIDDDTVFDIILHLFGNCEGRKCRLAEINPEAVCECGEYSPDEREIRSKRYRIAGVDKLILK